MIAKAWYCDATDCNAYTHPIPGGHPPMGWLVVHEGMGAETEPRAAGHFCSFDCVLKWVAAFPPTEFLNVGASNS